jgi:hypothetical protein
MADLTDSRALEGVMFKSIMQKKERKKRKGKHRKDVQM